MRRSVGKLAYRVLWPGLFLYLRNTQRARVVVIADGHILLVRSWLAPNNEWGIPGGGLHRGEDPRIGACREVTEETGVRLESDQCQFLVKRKPRAYGIQYDCYYYQVQLPRKVALRRQAGEIADVQWIKLTELPTTPHHAEIDILLASLARSA